MITNKAIVNLLEIFDTDFAKRKLSKDEMQHIVYSVQTCQSLSTEAMHYGNVVVEEIDDDEGTDYKKLWAAAPEMMEALEDAKRVIELVYPSSGYSDVPEVTLEKISAVLDKARGGGE